jgi:acyl-CoA reductase-like NAD-dependent aldehyde dehydrogenase
LTGGEQIQIGSKGYFYKPIIVKNVSPNMRVAQEEVFGPAAGGNRDSDEDNENNETIIIVDKYYSSTWYLSE